ncbi:50S ribosomal protein L14e, partial [Candidatus Woesearchaeota archaeon]|nr:50S ribosomal protein L14e [Candidatus Woesearchaeota archaeon]
MLNQIGRLVVKTAGRDAGKKALIVDSLDKSHVLIDGETRRRKCNIAHLEP